MFHGRTLVLSSRGMGTLATSHHHVAKRAKLNKIPTLADIPGPYAFPWVGVLPHYLPGVGKYDPKRILKSCTDKYHEFGPIFKETLFGSTLVFLANPDDIQTVLKSKGGSGSGVENWPKRITHMVLEHVRTHELSKYHHNGGIFMVNGQDWADIRHRHQKAMSLDEIGKFIPKCDEMALKLISQLDSTHPMMKEHVDKDFINVIFSYASDYMGMILFGEEWNSVENCLDPSSTSYKLIWSSTELNHATGPTDHGAQTWRLFSTPLYKTILKGATILDEVVTQRMNIRLEDGKLKAKDTDSLLDTWIRDGHQDYRQLVTLLSDLMLAGIDTVSYSLSFVIYHLSVNQVAQESLYNELRVLNPDAAAAITSSMVGGASYMKKCVKEALRLNPLAVGIGRVLTEDTVLSGYLVPEGTSIVTLNQVTSRLPEYVESPNAFIPERYNGDGKFKRIHPYVSIPFSHGPRSCVGRRLAEQNMNIFLFRLFRNYQVEWIGPKPLDCVTSLINKPDAPLLFKFTPRRN